ncbi:hypothetical protein H4582DRAFT_2064335 [Lactarius indigo]|nr:hypothetical protein H4582DRAFT_2064335 [Lactarius indigo]
MASDDDHIQTEVIGVRYWCWLLEVEPCGGNRYYSDRRDGLSAPATGVSKQLWTTWQIGDGVTGTFEIEHIQDVPVTPEWGTGPETEALNQNRNRNGTLPFGLGVQVQTEVPDQTSATLSELGRMFCKSLFEAWL